MIIGKRYRKASAQGGEYSEGNSVVLTSEEAAWVNEVFKNLIVVKEEFELRGSVFIDDLDNYQGYRENILRELAEKLFKILMELGSPDMKITKRLFQRTPLALTARKTQHGEALVAAVVVVQAVPPLPKALLKAWRAWRYPDFSSMDMRSISEDIPAIEFPEALLDENRR